MLKSSSFGVRKGTTRDNPSGSGDFTAFFGEAREICEEGGSRHWIRFERDRDYASSAAFFLSLFLSEIRS